MAAYFGLARQGQLQRGAREEAGRLKALIDQGTDPRELVKEQAKTKADAKAAKDEQQTLTESRKRYTLRALCNAYADLLESRGKKRSSAATKSAFKCHVLQAHPKLADLPANEITPLQVAAMVRTVRETGKERSAGILRSYLSAAFNAAKKSPFDASLPASLISFGISSNPVDSIPAIAVRSGKRTLSVDELRIYMATLGNDLAGRALALALMTGGQRMAQLLRATVNDYDPETKTLRLWDGKGRRREAREHLLPMAPRAAKLTAELVDRAKTIKSTWLFSTHGEVPMTFTTPGNRVSSLSAAMKGEPFDLRDIRCTVETMLGSMGISKDTRAQLLSHGISGVQATHYDHYSYVKEKHAALAAWENRLNEIATGKKSTNVVRMKKKKTA